MARGQKKPMDMAIDSLARFMLETTWMGICVSVFIHSEHVFTDGSITLQSHGLDWHNLHN
eukprot:scaffold189244_cov30-Attheya_sp.AAC.1